jgi:enamine deaminase RidA (YjgF/YER057c/UK114 family)
MAKEARLCLTTIAAPLATVNVLGETARTVSGEAEVSAMGETAESRLKALGITLPSIGAPAANYVPTVRTGNLLFVSGQVSFLGDEKYKGKLGRDLTVEQGQKAGRLCAINLIANIRNAVGSLDKVVRIVKLTGFVNCTPDFEEPHKVVNGCSDLLTDVFGPIGKHARSAVGMATLPLGAAVEVEAIVEIA